MPSWEKYDPEHQKLWDSMKVIRDQAALEAMAKKVNSYADVYKDVEKLTGVPWQMIAVIHIREAGLQDVGPFQKGIHNGQSWRQRTTIVPVGVGPFISWREAAVHALKLKGFDKIPLWTPAKMISACEPYNGYGYRNKGLRSPYLWASTNHQQLGKYVRDGVFDSRVMDTQMGCSAMLRYLGVGNAPVVVTPTPVAPKPPKPAPVKTAVKNTAVVATPAAGLAYAFPEWAPVIVFAGLAVLVGIYLYKRRNK